MNLPTIAVPDYLTKYPHFVTWRFREVDGRKTKIPYNPRNGRQASSTNSLHWTSFSDAHAAWELSGYDGIGFVFSENDNVIGIDIDHCVNPDTREILPWAKRIVDKLCSYTEYSPSLSGLHIFIRGKSFSGVNQINCIPGSKIEMYWRARFFTLSGLHVEGTPTQVEDRTQEFEELREEITKDAKLVESTLKRSDDDKAWKLWSGDWTDDYGSQSEADLALASILVWISEGDLEQAERLFGYSALWRPKWLELRGDQTYGDKTMELAKKSYESRFTAIAQGIDPQFTDYGNALRMWKAFNDELFYVPEFGKWFVWSGGRWVSDRTLTATKYAHKTIQALYAEAAAESDKQRRQDLIEHARRSEMGPRLRETENIAKAMMAVSSDQLDTDPMLFNVKNGTIDLNTGELLPHARERFITKLGPVTYNPAAKCPTWTAFLDSIFAGRQEVIRFLQAAVGYSLTAHIREQAFFFLYGVGSNGKSTFLSTIRAIMGDYASQADPTTFMAQGKTDGPRNDLARLVGKRFVTSIETEDGRKIAEGLMKQITGGEAITCRFLHQEFFEYVPTWKLWIAGNHRPSVVGQDHGFWRRMRLIPFTVTIPDEKQDKQLPQKLEAELPGILNWCLEGVRIWQEEGLKTPEIVVQATHEYRDVMDSIANFLDEAVDTGGEAEDKTNRTKVADMWQAYTHWCMLNRENPVNKRGFEARLRDKGFVSAKGAQNVSYWEGVQLRVGFKPTDIERRRPQESEAGMTVDELFS